MRSRRLLPIAIVILLSLALAPTSAFAHKERPTTSPARPGEVPSITRIKNQKPRMDVCKTKKADGSWECRFRDIQAAVDAAPDGALIRIWPGFYEELPSRAQADLPPDNSDGTWSFEFHKKHPNSQNLIGVVGKKNITLLGMGTRPRDVVIDAAFKKHVVIRGDRSDGLIVKNLSVWHGFDHGIYILETSGFVIDQVVSGYSREYAYLTFANDHGLQTRCEATGSGDGGLYPGGSADTPGRFSNEISFCKSYHNVLGYSGTQGDHTWIHDNEFYDNAVGLVTDSETDHPNYPENNLALTHNKFYDNNFNPYDPKSDLKATVFEGSILIPVGVGVLLASGNDNQVNDNWIWGHDRAGVWLLSGVGVVLGPTSDPAAPPFLPTNNEMIGNRMYAPPDVKAGKQNHFDFMWDGMGTGNCWYDNFSSPDGDAVSSDNPFLPPCLLPANLGPAPITAGIPWIPDYLEQLALIYQNGEPVCWQTGLEPCIWGPGPKPENSRNLPSGMRQEWPDPPTCGPSTCRTVLKNRDVLAKKKKK
jgi:hypothetical protein